MRRTESRKNAGTTEKMRKGMKKCKECGWCRWRGACAVADAAISNSKYPSLASSVFARAPFADSRVSFVCVVAIVADYRAKMRNKCEKRAIHRGTRHPRAHLRDSRGENRRMSRAIRCDSASMHSGHGETSRFTQNGVPFSWFCAVSFSGWTRNETPWHRRRHVSSGNVCSEYIFVEIPRLPAYQG